MSLSRRNFIKLSGMMVASLVLARIGPGKAAEEMEISDPFVFYDDIGLLPTLPPAESSSLPAREQLKQFWFVLLQENDSSEGLKLESRVRIQRMANHQGALDKLVTVGALSSSVAEIIQEAYVRVLIQIENKTPINKTGEDGTNTFTTCYDITFLSIEKSYRGSLLEQLQALEEIRTSNSVDAETLADLRAAIEREMVYFALTGVEGAALFDTRYGVGDISFETEDNLSEMFPDARAAAQFLIDLLVEE